MDTMNIILTDNSTGETTTLADERLKTIDKFRHIINNLPWDEINSGRFHPQQGCTTVAEVRDSLIALGCDSELLLEGASRQYCATVRTDITLYYYFDAESNELAEEHVQNLLQNEHITAYTAEEMEVDLYYGAVVEVETTGC